MKGNFNSFLKKKEVNDLFNDLFDAKQVDEDTVEIDYNRSAREAYQRMLDFFDKPEWMKKTRNKGE